MVRELARRLGGSLRFHHGNVEGDSHCKNFACRAMQGRKECNVKNGMEATVANDHCGGEEAEGVRLLPFYVSGSAFAPCLSLATMLLQTP